MTTNPPAVADEDALSVTRTIRIAAPVARVWQAVTDPAHISRWFGQTELQGRGAGAEGTMTFPEYATIPIRIERVDEPRMVTYRWNNDDALGEWRHGAFSEPHASIFTFTLEEVEGGTQLTVFETDFDRTSAPASNLRAHTAGWTSELDKLVALLEGEGTGADEDAAAAEGRA